MNPFFGLAFAVCLLLRLSYLLAADQLCDCSLPNRFYSKSIDWIRNSFDCIFRVGVDTVVPNRPWLVSRTLSSKHTVAQATLCTDKSDREIYREMSTFGHRRFQFLANRRCRQDLPTFCTTHNSTLDQRASFQRHIIQPATWLKEFIETTLPVPTVWNWMIFDAHKHTHNSQLQHSLLIIIRTVGVPIWISHTKKEVAHWLDASRSDAFNLRQDSQNSQLIFARLHRSSDRFKMKVKLQLDKKL